MRTGWRLFPTQEKGGGRKPQSPERKHNCQDVRARPLDRNCRIFQRKSCSQKGVGMRHVYVIGQGLHLTSPHELVFWNPPPFDVPGPRTPELRPSSSHESGRVRQLLQRPCEAVGVGAVDEFGCIAFESRGVCRRTT
ncbi:PREDICTED: uncharacterized protein LOC109374222 isoform X2 [Hipposideros armiger]|uniref:Uncharacterized protein LOC109374222 isoform X2 n=1 Tax=Hipposideros armiger TaxID=186990 RepID=A0A8B7Q8A0_HIPAR|nr:PREDICTED: uncharacterized protein LOC109374222 isoform X2 [Hipposideros armiger]